MDSGSSLGLGLDGAKVMLNSMEGEGEERDREEVMIVRKWRWVRLRVFRDEGLVRWRVDRAVVAADNVAVTAAMEVAGGGGRGLLVVLTS